MAKFFSLVLVFLAASPLDSATRMFLDRDARYKDILIVIAKDVKEDLTLVNKIKLGVQQASDVLFRATFRVGGFNKSFAFGHVHILLPNHWTGTSVSSSTWQREDLRDYHINLLGLGGGGAPRSVQPFDCGVPAMYSVMSVDYVNKVASKQFATELAHEFAHLRWGVFDEFNRYGPHYYYRDNKIVPIRCSLDITGSFQNDTTGTKCNFDQSTNSLPPDCKFVPDSNQQSDKASIMYATFLEHVQQFCSSQSNVLEFQHDSWAPNPQNRNCKGASVQEVMARHEDFTHGPRIIQQQPPTVSFTVVKQPLNTQIILIFDVSSSMSGTRIVNLKIGAIEYIRYLYANFHGVRVGLVKFTSSASTMMSVTSLNSQSVLSHFESAINALNAGGSTCIGCGLIQAMTIGGVDINRPSKEVLGYLVLFTDGADGNGPIYTQARNLLLDRLSLVVDAVSISNSADSRLKEIAVKTSGRDVFIKDNMPSNDIKALIIDILTGRIINYNHQVATESELSLYAEVSVSDIQVLSADIKPIVIAYFMKGGQLIVIPNAAITATVYADKASRIESILLHDDGNGADSEAEDGIYSGYILPFRIKTPQKYGVKVESSKPKSLVAFTNKLEVFSTNERALVQAPARVTTLEAHINVRHARLDLQWLAVGDEQEIGKANKYIIGISNNPDKLQKDFLTTLLVPVRSEIQEAGRVMTFSVLKQDIAFHADTFYMGLVAVSSTGMMSEVSNIVSVLFVRPTNYDEFKNTEDGSQNLTGTEIGLVTATSVFGVVAVGLVAYIVYARKKRSQITLSP